MSKINPEHTDRLIEMVNKTPFFQMIGMSLVEVSEGHSKVMLSVEPKHMNVFGGIYGGAYASILDGAAYWAAYCGLPEDAGFTTLDLDCDYHRAIDTGVVTAVGSVIKWGSTILLCEAKAYNEAGKLLASCSSKLFVSSTFQPISAAIVYIGVAALPPKFID